MTSIKTSISAIGSNRTGQRLNHSAQPKSEIVTPIPYDEWRALDDPFGEWTETFAKLAHGIHRAAKVGMACAAVGGAYGVIEGAQVPEKHLQLIAKVNFSALGAVVSYAAGQAGLAVGLSSIKQLGNLVALDLGITDTGRHTWKNLPQGTQQKVERQVRALTKASVKDPEASLMGQRVMDGIKGEIVGAMTGAAIGFRQGFEQGKQEGSALMETIQMQIYRNMHLATNL